ncbi:uncharacterized protein LOC121262108 [Juglans microcarpa x Juglans regia]|uniref:uncharacterized protein LOC121262108 n=1 Tax=Juglans microcarpa x Juglans regia TaxID=2249226 RepID=UPI001B7EEBAB|nr:uncharacterized protein LOC121262108 [Juglans microcarpa x Juglans regia]
MSGSYSMNDVKGALKRCKDQLSVWAKANGPYGFLAGFYQDNWDVIGTEVVSAVKEVLSSRRGVAGINETLIALIPKKKHPVLDERENGTYMALKLDMSKAYNRIEWEFLAAFMKKMGFEEEWSDMIIQCVGSVSYSLLINGSPQKVFHPSRGLRQGDPLSPYLFILCSEVLGTMLDKPEERGLYLASFLLEDLYWLVRLLNSFEVVSGPRFNMEKTTIYFSKNTRSDVNEAILSAAKLRETRSYEKYLAIPTYCMSIFKQPRAILSAINKLIQKFWWGSSSDRSKTQWLPWKQLGKAKTEGGLGYRDFEDFNVALLAKQDWRIIQQPHSLAARVLKAKYFYRSDFLRGKVGSNASYLWRSFMAAKQVLQEGLVWRIGNGEAVNIWHDRWIPCPSTFKVQSPLKEGYEGRLVSTLIDKSSGGWNIPLLRELFVVEEVAIISLLA